MDIQKQMGLPAIDVITIDVGCKHLVICETTGLKGVRPGDAGACVRPETYLRFWCLSVVMTDPVEACQSLYDQLATVECLGSRYWDSLPPIVIERQLASATNNMVLQSWLVAWFVQKEMAVQLQDPRLKYKDLVGAKANHKILGAQFAQTMFVNAGLCEIVRSPVMMKRPERCRWYSEKSWELLTAGRTEAELNEQPLPKLLEEQNQGYDKLDDLADTMLMAIAFLKK